MRILLVEDDEQLAENLKARLVKESYSVDLAFNGVDGLYQFSEFPYDLAIVDLGLPELDGISLIKEVRKNQVETPILILTARALWQEKVEGLDAGADDYLTKPFHPEELSARVNALIRRSVGKSDPEITAGPIRLNTRAKQVYLSDNQIDLTAYEYKVLEYLMLNPQKVISKTELTEHIYDQDFDLDSNVIEVFILRLRRKLDPDQSLKPISTLRGRGYQFNLDIE